MSLASPFMYIACDRVSHIYRLILSIPHRRSRIEPTSCDNIICPTLFCLVQAEIDPRQHISTRIGWTYYAPMRLSRQLFTTAAPMRPNRHHVVPSRRLLSSATVTRRSLRYFQHTEYCDIPADPSNTSPRDRKIKSS